MPTSMPARFVNIDRDTPRSLDERASVLDCWSALQLWLARKNANRSQGVPNLPTQASPPLTLDCHEWVTPMISVKRGELTPKNIPSQQPLNFIDSTR